MSLEIKGLTCARCKSYLFEEDDVVYCPVCGAPHHRSCYNDLGHCALEELHGTENEYKRPSVVEVKEEKKENTTKCEICGGEYNSSIGKCPKCSSPDFNRFGGFASFDFLGGVPADQDLGDGVTAEDAKNFVFANTHRYIPKFAILNSKRKKSWNWLGFLFPAPWMLSRKMYKGGIITLLLSVISNFLAYPFVLRLNTMGIDIGYYNYETVNQITESLPEIGNLLIALAFLGSLIDLGVRIFAGVFGDYFYKKHAIKTIKKIKSESSDIQSDYRKFGGVNFIIFFFGMLAMQYIPLILATLFLQ